MIPSPCARENEVVKLLARGAWPSACPAELRIHVTGCRRCGDMVLVTETFIKARAEAIGAAKASSPGTLWWRAQLRRRNEAVERLRRPMLGAEIFALTTYLVIAVVFLAYQARNGIGWLTWLEEIPEAHTPHFESLWHSTLLNSGWSLMLLIPLLATLALLGGVAVYLASKEERGERE